MHFVNVHRLSLFEGPDKTGMEKQDEPAQDQEGTLLGPTRCHCTDFHIFSLAAAFEGCWHECPGMFMIIKNTTRMETSTLGDLPRPFCRRAAVHELQARRLFMKSLQKDSQPEFLLMQWSWKHAWTCLKL